jgi:methyl-accepting chemotaxis protein
MEKRYTGKQIADAVEAGAGSIAAMLKAVLLDVDIAVSTYFEKTAAETVELNRQIARVVAAAEAGDFSAHIDMTSTNRDIETLAASVNNLMRTVEAGVGATSAALAAFAKADLTRRMEGSFEGEFARLQADVNGVAESLTGIIANLRNTSRSLKTATGEILSGANDLCERTIRQAATIEETSASMEQLAATVSDNARRAATASTKAHEVSRTATDGGAVMQQANAAMERITSSSAKISNIIGLIDDIAFQTNLLALNASVEAARAGEAGKGFAVVAVEVRRLAQSAAAASSEVKALIEQSGAEVAGGSRLVAEAAEKLAAMVEMAHESSGLIEGIADASKAQAAAIEEISSAVRTMDEMTQQNAALVEQTNAAIEQTEAQANALDGIVDVFSIDGEAAAATVPDGGQPGSVKALQQKLRAAAKNYLGNGNAAVSHDWAEF